MTKLVLTSSRTKERKGDPLLLSLNYYPGIRWRIEEIVEDWEPKDPKPHAVLWNWVEFKADVAPDCLTVHEVQSIVRWFMIRAKRSTWKQHRIQPISHRHRLLTRPGCCGASSIQLHDKRDRGS